MSGQCVPVRSIWPIELCSWLWFHLWLWLGLWCNHTVAAGIERARRVRLCLGAEADGRVYQRTSLRAAGDAGGGGGWMQRWQWAQTARSQWGSARSRGVSSGRSGGWWGHGPASAASSCLECAAMNLQ